MPKDLKPMKKRFSLTKEERLKVENIQSVLGILSLQQEGLRHSLRIELVGARQRLNLFDVDAPEGYTRNVGFDPETNEIIVEDIPTVKEVEPITSSTEK